MVKNINGEIYSDLITSRNPMPMNSSGRGGQKIDLIVIHHNATTSKDVAMNTWRQLAGNAGTSAHYEITPTEIIGCVGENYAAHHAGGTGGADVPKIANPNQRSIGLEHVNSSGAPSWSVAEDTLRQSAKLIADICKRYGLPINRNTIKGHNEITATACPGGINIDRLVQMAQQSATGQPKPQPKPTDPTVANPPFSTLSDGKGNYAHVDRFGPKGDKLWVNGWHVAPYAHEFLIFLDRRTGKEIPNTRRKAKDQHRPDVNKAYKTSGNVGFDEYIDLKLFKGRSVVVLMRATNDPKGDTKGGHQDFTETRWYHDL